MDLTPSNPVSTRRQLLARAAIAFAAGSQGLAGRAAAATDRESRATRASRSLDPRSPADLAYIAQKVRFRLDEGLVFAWLFGTKYGQVGPVLTPLLNIESGAISRVRHHAEGFAITTWERTFYTAIEDETPLRTWRNPYTQQEIPIRRGPSGPSTVLYRPDGSRVVDAQIGGAALEANTITRLIRISGDHVWISNDTNAIVTRQGDNNGRFQVTEWSTLHASLAKIADPATHSVDAEVSLQEVTSWAAWMNMGDRPGVVTSRGVGRKVLAFDQMPDSWTRLLAEHHPEIAHQPELALDAVAKPFEQ